MSSAPARLRGSINLSAYLAAAGGLGGDETRLPAADLPKRAATACRGHAGDIGRDARFQVSVPKPPTVHVPDRNDPVPRGLGADDVGALPRDVARRDGRGDHDASEGPTVGVLPAIWRAIVGTRSGTRRSGRPRSRRRALTLPPTRTGPALPPCAWPSSTDPGLYAPDGCHRAGCDEISPGKRQEYEFCRDKAQHPLMALYQDYDWADEVIHSHFGQEWIIRREHTPAIASPPSPRGDATMDKRIGFMSPIRDRRHRPRPVCPLAGHAG